MAGLPQPPVLLQSIPAQIVNEGGTLGPVDLKQFVQSPNEESGQIRFFAELLDGSSLPKGLACTSDGILTGIPAKGTVGGYDVVLIAENDSGIPFTTQFRLTVKATLAAEDKEKGVEWWTDLKSKVWEALGKELSEIPNIQELYDRPITSVEIYYLLQRFATLTIWDAYNLEIPGEKIILKLAGTSPHYHIYDRGSCLIAAPKELFSNERTLEDALGTARVMAREAYKRGWTIQLAGFEKMSRVAWIELQHLGDKHKKYLEILHYVPSPEDIQLYSKQAEMTRLLGG